MARVTGLAHALAAAVLICAVLEASSTTDNTRNPSDHAARAVVAGTKNKQIAKQFYATVDAIGAGKAGVAAFDEVAAADFHAHLPGGGTVDREGFKGVIQSFAVGFPGAIHDLEDLIAEGDRVVARMTWRSSHSGVFQGAPPTQHNIEMSEMAVLRIVNGKVAEFWPVFDSMALMSGAGVVKAGATKQ